MSQVSLDLAAFRPIRSWSPRIKDILISHGFVNTWYGIVNVTNQNNITIIKSSLPTLLFNYSDQEMEKNSITISTMKIRSSPNGRYSIIRNEDGSQIWYI